MPTTTTDASDASDAADARRAALLAALAVALHTRAIAAWLVGGALRDALLGRPLADLDVVVASDPLALANDLRHTLAERFDIAIAPLRHATVRLAISERAAAGAPPLQLDLSALAGGSIADDLAQRDFRINALALPLTTGAAALLTSARAALASHLLDPLGGVADLAARRLDPASAHAFADDPGRILRGARLIAGLGLAPTEGLRALARQYTPALTLLPADRLRDELNALLTLDAAAAGVAWLADCGALPILFGAALASPASQERVGAALAATSAFGQGGATSAIAPATASLAPLAAGAPLRAWLAATLPDGLPRSGALRWGLLAAATIAPPIGADAGGADAGDATVAADMQALARAGVGAVRAVCARIPLANATCALAAAACSGALLRPTLAAAAPDLPFQRRLFATLGDSAILTLLAAAISSAIDPASPADARVVAQRAQAIIQRYFTDRSSLMPAPLLTGSDLLGELGLAPGPDIKRILAAVRAAQLAGALTDRAAALAFARAQHHQGATPPA